MASARTLVLSIPILFACCSIAVAAAQEAAQPKLSAKALTRDQVAVYQAFLAGYQARSKHPLNVANVTDPFQPDKDDFQGCMKTFPRNSCATEVHQFTDQFSPDIVHLVDPAKYKVASVGDFMQKNDDLDSAVTSAVAAGMMTLSEVLFDRPHHLAAISIDFQCGRLCGHGGTVLFELRKGHWNRSKRFCGGWQS